MTIKQAAMWLCQPGIVSMIHDPTTKKALSVAVKALAESEHGTNLAEVGTDCISRQAAIEAVQNNRHMMLNKEKVLLINDLEKLPTAQPEIIRCKDCKWWDRYNDNNGYCMAAKSCTYTSHWDIQIRRTYDGDFYCAHAEPKEEYEEDEDE